VLLAGGVLLATAWTASGIVHAANIHTGGLRVGAGLLLIALMLSDTVRIGSAAAQPATASGPVEALPAGGDDEHAAARSTASRLANAGTLATVALYSGEWFELWRRGVAMAAVIATAAVAYGLLRIGDRVRAELGDAGLTWVTIAMNLVTLAWVADFTAIGVRDLLPLILTTPPAR
jgi:small neutral amino acid transporter SnatA (MarC family)